MDQSKLGQVINTFQVSEDNDYSFDRRLWTSTLKRGLKTKYLTQHLQPYVLAGIAVWLLYMLQTLHAIAYVQNYYGAAVIYHTN